MQRQRRQEFFAGIKATMPLIIGAMPFGVIYGTLAQNSDLSIAAAMAMSVIVFAGASQFIVLGLLSAGASIPIIIATTFLVNLRHLLYSAAMTKHVSHLPQKWRVPLAFGLTDETFAAISQRYKSPDITFAHWFYLGSAIGMYTNWQICTWVGITLGETFPNVADWGLDFAMSATFIGIIAPYLVTRPMWAGVIAAALLSLSLYDLPHKLGLIIAAICAIAIAFTYQYLQNRPINNELLEGRNCE